MLDDENKRSGILVTLHCNSGELLVNLILLLERAKLFQEDLDGSAPKNRDCNPSLILTSVFSPEQLFISRQSSPLQHI